MIDVKDIRKTGKDHRIGHGGKRWGVDDDSGVALSQNLDELHHSGGSQELRGIGGDRPAGHCIEVGNACLHNHVTELASADQDIGHPLVPWNAEDLVGGGLSHVTVRVAYNSS